MGSIKALPVKRGAGTALTKKSLKALIRLLQAFLASANNRSAPGKNELFAAVQSLVKPDSRRLSRQWDKTQLALALFRWVHEALNLGPEHSQSELTIVINAETNDPSLLGHSIYLYDEVAGATETIAVQSPSPVKPQRTPRVSPIGAVDSPAGVPSCEELASNGSIRSNESLLVEIEGLGEFDSLAAIPTFFTPRVLNPGGNAEDFASPAGSSR